MKNLRAKYRDKFETVFGYVYFGLVGLVVLAVLCARMYVTYNNPPTHMVIGGFVYKVN